MALVYLVEDDDSIRDLILYALKTTEFEAEGFESSDSFWKGLQTSRPNVVLLDIMLPGLDGLSILQTLRSQSHTSALPVIILTAKSGEFDRVQGLELGADDYVTKPFSVLELLSRIRAVLRRAQNSREMEPVLILGEVQLNAARRHVQVSGQPVVLTYKEFELLQLMMENPGLVFTRSRLLSAIWDMDYEGETRTVDMHIKTLRHKLGPARDVIQTVRGVGYKVGE